MQNSILISILSKFTRREIKEFKEFIISPFFNKNESVIKLYNYIKRFYPVFEDKKLDKEYIYRKIYSKARYNDGLMRTNIFRLQKLAENYLIYLKSTRNSIVNGINFSREILERELYRVFEKNVTEIEKSLESVKFKDEEYFDMKLDYENIVAAYHNSYAEDVFKYKKRYVGNEFYPDRTKTLRISFFLKMLSTYRFLLNEQILFNFKYNFEFLDEILSYLNKSKLYEENPFLKVHYLELLLLKDTEERYYWELKDTFINEIENLNWESKLSTLAILINYCTYAIREEKKDFHQEKFELTKLRLKYKLYSYKEGGSFHDNIFMNIVQMGISLKEYDWTEKFINDYSGTLDNTFRKPAFYLAMAELNFAKKSFNESLASLSKITNLANVDYKLSVKMLTARIYYELNFQNEFYGALDAFRHFLSSNKLLSESRKQLYSAFIKNLNTLMKCKSKPESNNLKEFKSELENGLSLPNNKWFLDKIREIELNVK